MHAEVLAIGDEITSGQTLDTNSQWLSQRLEELGVAVRYHSTAGDQLPACTEIFRHAIERADVVVATGGLGPTADDLTRDALAAAAGRPLEMDADAMEYIRRMFARRNRPMPPQNQRQALFPAGSRVVLNPHGTAPGIDLEVPRRAGRRAACFACPACRPKWSRCGTARSLRQLPPCWATTGESSAGGGSTVSGPARAKSSRCCPT